MVTCIAIMYSVKAQEINWSPDGAGFVRFKEGNIIKVDPRTDAETVLIKSELLIPAGKTAALRPQSFEYSADKSKVLLFTHTVKVWRYRTRGDYWVLSGNKLTQLGKGLGLQSLMFAKFSPDGKTVAYVSDHNIFIEDIATGIIKKMTMDGTRKLINGTFDWAYEEEFFAGMAFAGAPMASILLFGR